MKAFYRGLKVNKKFLLSTLNPTSKGTKWYDSPPENIITNRQIGRILLQFHQVAEKINFYGNKKKLKFIDVGTGNGILPELVSKYCKCKLSHGIDPYEDGEHTTSWPTGTRYKLLNKINKFLRQKYLDIKNYKNYLNFEGYSNSPKRIELYNNKIKWKFYKKFINEISTKQKYNFIFAKCIDHISDWDDLFENISKRSEVDATLFIKHNSFFSYNGAHRYASTFLPWGHVILNDKEYKDYVKKFHKTRVNEMNNFFFKGLSYPRNTLDQLLEILIKNKWRIVHIEQSNKKNYQKLLKYAGGQKNLLKLAKRNYPSISLSELISDRILIIAKKMK